MAYIGRARAYIFLNVKFSVVCLDPVTQGCNKTFVYPSILLSNFSYASAASSRERLCETTKDGLALPAMIKSRRYRLYVCEYLAKGMWIRKKGADLDVTLASSEGQSFLE